MSPEKALPDSVFVFYYILRETISMHSISHNHSPIYPQHSKQLIRDDSNMIILFKQNETNLKHVYTELCSSDINYSKYKEFCTLCCKGRFNFVVISKDCETQFKIVWLLVSRPHYTINIIVNIKSIVNIIGRLKWPLYVQ